MGSAHSIVSHVDVMWLISCHPFLTVFYWVRALVFSLEMGTKSSQKCQGVTDEDLTLEVPSTISPRRRMVEQSQGCASAYPPKAKLPGFVS